MTSGSEAGDSLFLGGRLSDRLKPGPTAQGDAMDHRDVAGRFRPPYHVDEKANRITFTVDSLTEDEEEVSVPIQWEVCPTCEGRGHHVNPSIDSHGLTREDFDDDPDFFEDYRSGVYDVPCAECGGQRVVPTSDDPRFIELVEGAWESARDRTREIELGY